MNQRIRPDDLDSAPYKELIQSLTLQWVRIELPADELTFTDYTRTIRVLLLTTQDPDRTAEIVRAVLTQATDLNKTSRWVDQELKFEGMIHGADRHDFLRLELSQAPDIDDALLDMYNERLNRFATRGDTAGL
ncbi:hypothetical protein [Spirosoma agri]|uniref:Uncharacterized protein n=1 Tax=Spirosoma agri TaxID=1987381 RepID=A0A6M0IT41_9BACT|nr:hypothetical protein [Spirosoma agri]NEU70313.1 hypothetical protein [Spirosoma agri]